MPDPSDTEDHPDNSGNEERSLPPQQASLPSEAQTLSAAQLPPEILEKLPESDRAQVLEFFSAALHMSGPTGNPFIEKLEPQHISGMIALASKTADHTLS